MTWLAYDVGGGVLTHCIHSRGLEGFLKPNESVQAEMGVCDLHRT